MINKHISDLIFIKWLIGVIFFFLFIYLLSYFDFLSSLINNDASYISSLIFIIFFLLLNKSWNRVILFTNEICKY